MEKISSARIALKWGIIYGICSVIFNTLLYTTELWKNWILTFLFTFLVCSAVVYFAFSEFKKLNGGYMSFSEGLSLGTLTITTGGIIGLVYDFVYRIYIDKNILKQQLDMAQEEYESMGMSEEQISMAIEKAQNYSTSGITFVLGVLFIVILGLIFSAIMAAILKKPKPLFN